MKKFKGIKFDKRFSKGESIFISIFPSANIVIHNIYEDEFGIEIQFGWINFKFGWLFRIAKESK